MVGLFRNLNFQKGNNVASHLEGDSVVHRIHIANNLLGPTLPLPSQSHQKRFHSLHPGICLTAKFLEIPTSTLPSALHLTPCGGAFDCQPEVADECARARGSGCWWYPTRSTIDAASRSSKREVASSNSAARVRQDCGWEWVSVD